MAAIDRRQLLKFMAAATACAAAGPGGAIATEAASQLSRYSNGLFLLAANSNRVSDLRQGWLPIIAAALEKMNALDPDFEIRQIKQKFGRLRIYYRSHHRERLKEAVQEARVLCGKTCEECGRPGSPFNQSGFIRTLCGRHLAVRSPEISVIMLARPVDRSDRPERADVIEADVRFIYVEAQRHASGSTGSVSQLRGDTESSTTLAAKRPQTA